MIDLKLYMVNYMLLARGGVGNPILCKLPEATLAFSDESEMLKEVAKLKKDNCVENIRVYVNKYKLESREKYEI